MNTDASNVEDINNHQIKERLSMSCIASFEDWSNIFRNRSFTLCKNLFCVLFDITSRHLVELKMADVEHTQKMIRFITCEVSLCQYVCELILVSMYLIWILGSKLILSNNQSRATLWVLGTCLIVGLLPFYDHLDHCFVVFKDIQQSFLMRRIDV